MCNTDLSGPLPDRNQSANAELSRSPAGLGHEWRERSESEAGISGGTATGSPASSTATMVKYELLV